VSRTAISADKPITVDLLDRCLDRLAYAMQQSPQGGEVYLPIFERFEAELASLKAKEAMLERARVRSARFMREHAPTAVTGMIEDGIEGVLILTDDDENLAEIAARFTRATGRLYGAT
jgi:hypothetical protein